MILFFFIIKKYEWFLILKIIFVRSTNNYNDNNDNDNLEMQTDHLILARWPDLIIISYLPTPPLGQDMTQGHF